MEAGLCLTWMRVTVWPLERRLSTAHLRAYWLLLSLSIATVTASPSLERRLSTFPFPMRLPFPFPLAFHIQPVRSICYHLPLNQMELSRSRSSLFLLSIFYTYKDLILTPSNPISLNHGARVKDRINLYLSLFLSPPSSLSLYWRRQLRVSFDVLCFLLEG